MPVFQGTNAPKLNYQGLGQLGNPCDLSRRERELQQLANNVEALKEHVDDDQVASFAIIGELLDDLVHNGTARLRLSSGHVVTINGAFVPNGWQIDDGATVGATRRSNGKRTDWYADVTDQNCLTRVP